MEFLVVRRIFVACPQQERHRIWQAESGKRFIHDSLPKTAGTHLSTFYVIMFIILYGYSTNVHRWSVATCCFA